MTIQLTKRQIGFSANLTVNLGDTISQRNMTGANVFGALTGLRGNKTTVLFTETQPEVYKAHLIFKETTTTNIYNLTITASKPGYTSQTLTTSLAVPPDTHIIFNLNPDPATVIDTIILEGSLTEARAPLEPSHKQAHTKSPCYIEDQTDTTGAITSKT